MSGRHWETEVQLTVLWRSELALPDIKERTKELLRYKRRRLEEQLSAVRKEEDEEEMALSISQEAGPNSPTDTNSPAAMQW